MSELSQVRLGEICQLKAGNAFPKEQQGIALGDLPFIKVSDFELPSNERKITKANNYISDVIARKLKIKKHRAGGVAFAKIGIALTYNRRRILTRETAVDNNLMVAEGNSEICDDLYFYYLLKTVDFNLIANGSAIPYLNSSDIKNIEVAIHGKSEQKAIAHILGTLDNKIELNRKTNETLEAMAKALFKSWFVDFDPVRAKAEGRPTGLPAEISDLFPDSFEDSELGEIPSGWKISNLGSLIKQCGEPIQASSTTMELPYVPIDCISNKSLALREYKSGAEANTSLLQFREGDLLFGAMRPYFHKVCIAPFDGTTRTTCFALRPFTDSHYAFVAMLLSAASTIEYATLNSTGSTIPYIRWSNGLENMLSIQPPDPILDSFNKTALPILRKISISLFTERPIAAVRDILLPKLISGEIRIPDAEQMLEEVGI